MKRIADSYISQLVSVLSCWLLFVAAIAAIFRSWWVFELCLFPSIVFAWMLRNEQRLKRTRPDLPQLRPGVKIHFFITVPLLIAIRLMFSVSQSVREADAWRLMLAMSFGLAWVLVILYAFGIVSRKTAASKSNGTQQNAVSGK